jgi:CDP-glucose 4,6-dehydratase
MFEIIYHDRRILVTGHTGFKGSWLSSWLFDLGATVAGFSTNVPTKPSHFEVLRLTDRIEHFEGDVRNKGSLQKAIDKFCPEIVFHESLMKILLSLSKPILPALKIYSNVFATNLLSRRLF